MKLALLALVFITISKVSSPLAEAQHATASLPKKLELRAEIKKAVASWLRLKNCQSLLLKASQSAAYNRCLQDVMPEPSDRFDQMKMTEFLMLEIPVTALGHCPRSLENAQASRQRKASAPSRYACFIVSNEDKTDAGRISGEVEFVESKNGELKVRRIRYSY